MDKISPLFTATATAVGGRNGHTETSDGIVKADLSVPREMGGPGKPGAATPEHLSPRAMPPASAGRSTSWQSRRNAMPRRPRSSAP
jgi:hypothetical protein